MTKKVVVPGAFDSKGEEYSYLIDLIKEQGYEVVTINTGVLGSTDLFVVDIAADQVAEAGGTDLSTLREERDRGKAIGVMSDGLASVLKELFEKHNIDGIIGMGGSAGTNVVTSGMRVLPYGVPKICISTVASGDVAPYVGVSDIIMIPSLIDIAGINSLSTAIFSRAVGALSGMIEIKTDGRTTESGPVIAASMFGNTTPCIDACREVLADKGFDVLVFHATGTGGKTMEKLIDEGRVQGALDITTTEWADTICGGVFDAGPERLDGPGKAGIPHLIAPGCIDMCNFGNPSTIPSKYEDRLFYEWNPQVTLMRTTAEENYKIGEVFAEKANRSNGKVAFLIPLQGYSMLDSVEDGEPQIFWDPEADQAFVDGLKSELDPGIEVARVDANINDPVFSDKAVEMLLNMM
ncbi:Tm-1-like ATP-binding domain-containing protein [Halalkalibaculum sp. DA384]|uniref:Tm-1-like ATP-binding domain-containing protein n=1 Tax=Halalkalibaculum sp. DA384 TaxID=3373606 RepID=UPI003753F1B5